MSWFFKALQSDDSDSSGPQQNQSQDQGITPISSVREDLSAFSQTLGRQIRGVASFLAPPPQSTVHASDVVSADSSSPSSDALLGISKDLVEIAGSLRTGFSLLSSNSNKAVGEISRLATNLLQLPDEPTEEDDYEDEEDEDESTGGVPGVTEEVLDFVTEMTSQPQFWTDFPLAIEYTDFALSNVQTLHASTVEQLAPSLSALRVELQSSMSQERFWIIYFIMLLPRLDEHEFQLLATPKIVEAREMFMQKLQDKNNTQMDSGTANVIEVIGETEGLGIHEEENPEKWLEEADIDSETSGEGRKIFEHEEDVSFSDLEDDENDLSTRFSEKRVGRDSKAASSPNESSEWVQLNQDSEAKGVLQKFKEKESEGEESNDWLTIDEF